MKTGPENDQREGEVVNKDDAEIEQHVDLDQFLPREAIEPSAKTVNSTGRPRRRTEMQARTGQAGKVLILPVKLAKYETNACHFEFSPPVRQPPFSLEGFAPASLAGGFNEILVGWA